MFVAADGTNYETANSYASVSYANDYFSLRLNSAWTGSDSVKQAALIKATDYIEQTYSQRFIGVIGNLPQLLSWPRYVPYAPIESDEIPEGVKKATCELALEALTGNLNPVIDRSVQKRIKKIDVIEYEYSEGDTQTPLRPAVIGYLQPLLKGSGFNRNVVRV